MYTESSQAKLLRVHSRWSCADIRLLILLVEVIVGGVRHELRLANGTSARWRSASVGVQALNEGGLEQQTTAGGPFFTSK